MKNHTLLITLFALIGCLVLPQESHAAVEVNGIAAKVNGRVITKNEVAVLLAPTRAYLSAKFPLKGAEYEKEIRESRDKILDELIERELVLYEFKNNLGGSLPDSAIDSEIQRRINTQYNGKESLMREELAKQGMGYQRFRELVRRSLIVQAMKGRQFASVAPPTPDELRQEYNKIKTDLRDTSKDRCDFQKIFIPLEDEEDILSTPESQYQLAQDLAKQINNGADFKALAREYSTDSFADDGGVQKDFPRSNLSPVIAQQMFEAPTGSLIGPLSDGNGFHIIRCTNKDFGPTPPLSDPKVRDLVEGNVSREKSNARFQRWIQGLQRNAMIERKM